MTKRGGRSKVLRVPGANTFDDLRWPFRIGDKVVLSKLGKQTGFVLKEATVTGLVILDYTLTGDLRGVRLVDTGNKYEQTYHLDFLKKVQAMSLTVIEYVTEEVRRQGHDVTALDGIERVGWMLDAWAYALKCADKAPDISDVLFLGRAIEPDKNDGGFRRCGVRVGIRVCPPPNYVPGLMVALFGLEGLTPIEFYKEFELIHPFVDGNGRCGKILLAWLSGKLLCPEFPPADLFGEAILNP